MHNHPLKFIDPDGQFAFFLIPIAISLATNYCLPAATAYMAQYAGGVAAASFLTGLASGYNDPLSTAFDANTYSLGDGDLTSTLLNKAGMLAGTLIACAPQNIAVNGSKAAVTTVGNKVLSAVTTSAIANVETTLTRAVTKTVTNSVKATAQKTAVAAEQYIAKEGLQLAKQNSGKISQLEGKLSNWLGKGSKFVKNEAGDSVFLSTNASKRVRFDFLRPNPHSNPHMHIEEFINGKWNKSGPIYPFDIPHY